MCDFGVIESLELQVKLTVLMDIDNLGTVDLENNWSVGSRTRNIETPQQYLCELKEEDYLVVKWIIDEENETDIFTKNSAGKYSIGTLECNVRIMKALSQQGCQKSKMMGNTLSPTICVKWKRQGYYH